MSQVRRDSNKLAESFLYEMHHDLRSNLNAITGILQLITVGDLPAEHKTQARAGLMAASHLLHMIGSMIEFSQVTLRGQQLSVDKKNKSELDIYIAKLRAEHTEISRCLESNLNSLISISET